MLDPRTVAALVRSLLHPFDAATAKSIELILMLLECSRDPFSRAQFTPGHITCSGLVVSPDGGRLLIVHHRRLNRWLLPGGHVEAADTTVDAAAVREVLEETGIPVGDGCFAGADVHGIPSNGREPYHLHHDLLFRFRAGVESVSISDESHAVAWCGPEEFERYAIPANIRLAWTRSHR